MVFYSGGVRACIDAGLSVVSVRLFPRRVTAGWRLSLWRAYDVDRLDTRTQKRIPSRFSTNEENYAKRTKFGAVRLEL